MNNRERWVPVLWGNRGWVSAGMTLVSEGHETSILSFYDQECEHSNATVFTQKENCDALIRLMKQDEFVAIRDKVCACGTEPAPWLDTVTGKNVCSDCVNAQTTKQEEK